MKKIKRKQTYLKGLNSIEREQNKKSYFKWYNDNFRLEKRLAKKYGITLEKYNEMITSQKGVCAICGGTSKGRPLDLDHNHNTGEIRGLLCRNCNVAIGMLKDNKDLVSKMLSYLS